MAAIAVWRPEQKTPGPSSYWDRQLQRKRQDGKPNDLDVNRSSAERAPRPHPGEE